MGVPTGIPDVARDSAARPELGQQRLLLAPGDWQDAVDRRFELDLPVGAGAAAAELGDTAEVDGVVAVDAQEAEGGEGPGQRWSRRRSLPRRRTQVALPSASTQ